ncbi:MAG TPA: type 4a pilus biogenesis protein PilO [bacterium]|nr:type 4a pilus biogenesis protein PilO [bacterium]
MTSLRPQERFLLRAGLAVVALIILGLFVFYPQFRGVATARLEARRKQAELARLTALAQQRPEIIRKHETVKQAARDLLERLPSDPGVPDLMLRLDTAMTSSRVALVQLTFLPESPTAGNVGSLPVQLRLRGNYPQMRALVQSLEESPRLMVIDRVAFSGSETGIIADIVVRALFVR